MNLETIDYVIIGVVLVLIIIIFRGLSSNDSSIENMGGLSIPTSSYQFSINKFKSQIAKSGGIIYSQKKQIDASMTKIKSLESELLLQQQNPLIASQLKSTLNEQRKILASLQNTLKYYEHELDGFKDQLMNVYQNKIAQLQNEIAQLRKSNRLFQKQYKYFYLSNNKDKKQMQKKYDELHKNYDQVKKQLNTAKNSLNMAKKSLYTALDVAEGTAKQIKAEVDKIGTSPVIGNPYLPPGLGQPPKMPGKPGTIGPKPPAGIGGPKPPGSIGSF
jgi:chromosome segregation ATPase